MKRWKGIIISVLVIIIIICFYFMFSDGITFIDPKTVELHPGLRDPEQYNKLRNIQKNGLYLLKTFIKICKENDLVYFAIGGTLIGAVRHHAWIPFDDDIDIAMFPEDLDKFYNIYQKSPYLKSILKIKLSNDKQWGKLYQIYFTDKMERERGWGQVDVFAIIPNLNNKYSVFSSGEPSTSLHNILPLKEQKFEDIIVNIPRNPKIYISEADDNDNVNILPDVENRKPGHSMLSL